MGFCWFGCLLYFSVFVLDVLFLLVLFQTCRNSFGLVEQVRAYYVDWRMLRDVKRRQMAYEFADTRLRMNAIRKNTLLPKELQVIKSKLITSSDTYQETHSQYSSRKLVADLWGM